VNGELTKAQLEAWVIQMREHGQSNGGVNCYLRSLNSYCAWLHERGLAPTKVRLKLLPNPNRQTM
jgi:hypothetical protein